MNEPLAVVLGYRASSSSAPPNLIIVYSWLYP